MRLKNKMTKGVLTVALMTTSFGPLLAQDQQVKLELKQVSLRQVLRAIEEQTNYRFSYKESILDNKQDISLSLKATSVKQVLEQVLSQRGLSYELVSDRSIVIVSKAQTPQTSNAKRRITGVIKDNKGEAVIGATVRDKKGTTGTTTDLDGRFTIEVPGNTTLAISYIGYASQDLALGAANNYNITLLEDSKTLNEVVVTGYMTEKKADLTGSVAVVKMKEVADIPTGNVLSSLQGRVSGMNVSTDGTPGGGNTGVQIRGLTTINNSSPLYVVDGMMTRDNIGTIISSGDIESIQVLKDAASASIYGAQAANGVIIITTKKAKQGAIKVDFSGSLTAQTFTTNIELLNAQQWGDVYWQAYKYANAGRTPSSLVYGNGPNAVLQDYYYDQNGSKIRVGNTDWLREIYSTALMQNYNLTLSRGGDNGASSLSVNYVDQDGLIRNSDYQSLNTRLFSEYKFLNNRLRLGENMTVNYWTRHMHPGGLEESLIAMHPAIPTHDEQGNYAGGYIDVLGDKANPLRLTDNEANNKHSHWRIFGSAYAEVEPIKNLIFRTSFGINYLTENHRAFTPKWREGARNVEKNELRTDNKTNLEWVWTNTLNYSHAFGKHNLSALLGTEAKRNRFEDVWGYGTGFSMEDINYRYLVAATQSKDTGGNASVYSMVSYFGKLNYNYDERYLASLTLRRDASSRFGAKNNSGIFPSFSAGWRISREQFLKDVQWISDLKLRASWGINGNDQIDNNATYNLYANSLNDASYNLSGDGKTLASGALRTHLGNPNLRWEETEQINVGVDASFFNHRLTLGFDYFDKKTRDMLNEPPYAAVLGQGGYSWQNALAMSNKGFELNLGWRDNIGELRYEIGLNLSHYSNKITHLPDLIYYTYGVGNGVNITNVGLPFNSWLGYRTQGVFKTDQEVADYRSQYQVEYGDPGVGRLRYVDANNDGKINAADRVYMGTDQPKLMGGLNLSLGYKGFDLSMFFSGVARDAWNNAKFYTDFFQLWQGNHSTRLLEALDAWKNYEQTGVYNSSIPALTTSNTNNENQSSDYFVEDGSFIRLKTLTLGYTIPQSILKALKMSHARVYIQGQNLFTLTRYNGADPEGLGYPYPMPRSFTFGLTFGF